MKYIFDNIVQKILQPYLFPYGRKRMVMIMGAFSVVLYGIIYLLKIENTILKQMLSMLGIVCLFMIIFSKEKIEDERVKDIRFRVTRVCFKIILLIGILNIIQPRFKIPFDNLTIAIMILYVLLFQYALRKEPEWLKEREIPATNKIKWKVYLVIFGATFILGAIAYYFFEVMGYK